MMPESAERKIHDFMCQFDHDGNANEYFQAFTACEKEIKEVLKKHGFDVGKGE